MKIEVRGNRVLIRFICGILNRRIVKDVVLLGDDDNPARMLARGDLDILAALCNAFLLRAAQHLPRLFLIDADIVKRSTLRNAADCSRAERMPAAEHLLDVFMRNGLVFAGEVKIDIRRLVAVEAQKHLKRDIKSHLIIAAAADGAILIRHVDAAGIEQAVYGKVAVLAVRADIVRLKRVYLRDSRHGCDK
ncbi:hypothetical protein SDC9_79527 [bioreactor metagenome]|uniref:Uncharacterized protein n=1 Tax=bioreactor metagenome TaxID=1076179 RepID=A0A644YWI2_9ZZZZ